MGQRNTGCWNMCSGSTGFFNTKERTVTIFNKDSGLTFEECCSSDWFFALYSAPFNLVEFIEITDKKYTVSHQNMHNYMKEYAFRDACTNWWNLMRDENKALIQTIPNFDKDIFKEITGIDIDGHLLT